MIRPKSVRQHRWEWPLRFQGIVHFGVWSSITVLSLEDTSEDWGRKEYSKWAWSRLLNNIRFIGCTKIHGIFGKYYSNLLRNEAHINHYSMKKYELFDNELMLLYLNERCWFYNRTVKTVTWPGPTRSITDWSLNESTQLDSLISESKKFEPGPAHHKLVG